MRPSTCPMRSSSSRVRTMKVTSQSGDALVISFVVDYLHTDRAKATGNRGVPIDSTASRRDRSTSRAPARARGQALGHRGAQRVVVAQIARAAERAVESARRVAEDRDAAASSSSGRPPARVATIGRPAASASSATVGAPSMRDGIASTSAAASSSRLSSPATSPKKRTRAPRRSPARLREPRARARRRRRAASAPSGSASISEVDALVADQAAEEQRRRSRRDRSAHAPPCALALASPAAIGATSIAIGTTRPGAPSTRSASAT